MRKKSEPPHTSLKIGLLVLTATLIVMVDYASTKKQARTQLKQSSKNIGAKK